MPRTNIALVAMVAMLLVSTCTLHAEDDSRNTKRAKAILDSDDFKGSVAECDEVISECDKAIAADPGAAEAYRIRGRAHAYKRESDAAISDFNKAIALNPNSSETYVNRSNAWLQKNRIDEAIADCNAALKLDPKSSSAYRERGFVLGFKSEDERAIADFRQALALKPDAWNAMNSLGVSLWKVANLEDRRAAAADAAGELKTAKDCRQKSVALRDETKDLWLRGVKINPRACDIHANLAYVYSEAGDLDATERHLRRAVELKPVAPRLRNNLGRILLRRWSLLEKEARAAEAKVKADPAEAESAKKLWSDAKLQRKAAIEQFDKAIELYPALHEARLNLGEAWMQANDLDKAEAQYNAILKYQEHAASVGAAAGPDNSENVAHAYTGLARIAIARKKPDDAIAYCQRAIVANPKDDYAKRLLTSLQKPAATNQ